MKILYLGDLAPGQTSGMRKRALERLGHEVRGVDTAAPWKEASWLARQTQRRLRKGSIVATINRRVDEAAREFRPNLLWADKQEYLRAGTVRALAKLGARSVHFTPDPYFTLTWKRTPVMDEALGAFDGLIYCKSYERSEYEALDKPTHTCRWVFVTRRTGHCLRMIPAGGARSGFWVAGTRGGSWGECADERRCLAF